MEPNSTSKLVAIAKLASVTGKLSMMKFEGLQSKPAPPNRSCQAREKMMRPAQPAIQIQSTTKNPKRIVVVKAPKRRGEHSLLQSLAFETYCLALQASAVVSSLSEEAERYVHSKLKNQHILRSPSKPTFHQPDIET